MPATEIEIKARVSDPDALVVRLNETGFKKLRDYEKQDQYFRLSSGSKIDLRIRKDGDISYLTFKDKLIDGGIEQNREYESEVSDPSVLVELLTRIGFTKKIDKHKKGFAYQKDEVLAEVSMIRGLGWFVELEIVVVDDANPTLIEESRKILMSLLSQLGIPDSAIEERPYTVMLQLLGSET